MIDNLNNSNIDELNGVYALRLASEISRVKDLTFDIAFYPYSRTKGYASNKLVVKKGCRTRAQLPQDRFEVCGDNYFLFVDSNGKHQTAYRYLIRFMAFPQDNFKMHKINWL